MGFKGELITQARYADGVLSNLCWLLSKNAKKSFVVMQLIYTATSLFIVVRAPNITFSKTMTTMVIFL